MTMKNNKKIYIVLSIMVTVIALGEAAYIIRTKDSRMQNGNIQKDLSVATTTEKTKNPCSLARAPDGTMVTLCEPSLAVVMAVPTSIPGLPSDINPNQVFLPTSGTGTTTLKKATPLNDILIAETASPYASLRNARYTVWPYPGDSVFKEIYLVLPDIYDPIFSGYSNKQFIEFDGIKNTIIYLRHKESTGVGPDVRILIESPTATNEQDHPLKLFDRNDSWAGFSVVARGKEAVVEVVFTTPAGLSLDKEASAQTEILRAVANMEIVW